ncbi:MAG: hypothetical protein JW754_00890 [Candidatus Aenigmarchaeota archaeon]|nr:hypothetical protein [Candidatus Aenigmarchaeota archaeon]
MNMDEISKKDYAGRTVFRMGKTYGQGYSFRKGSLVVSDGAYDSPDDVIARPVYFEGDKAMIGAECKIVKRRSLRFTNKNVPGKNEIFPEDQIEILIREQAQKKIGYKFKQLAKKASALIPDMI